jgi:hypothetical protein
MSLSATTVALILTISSSAHGSPVVIGEVRVDGPAETQIPQSTEVQIGAAAVSKAPVGAESTASTSPAASAEPEAPTEEDSALYGRFFGGEAAPQAEAPVVEAARESAWPWWIWPVGMLSVGVLFLVRGKAREKFLPTQAIRIISRSAMGKEGTLAVIEVADGDHRTRRLLVGFGGGAPRLVADVSAWDVAVAAPAPEDIAAPHHTGEDPMRLVPSVVEPVTFGGSLKAAAARYVPGPLEAAPAPERTVPPQQIPVAHDDLVAEVLAMRDSKEIVSATPSKGRPAYSRRQVVA